MATRPGQHEGSPLLADRARDSARAGFPAASTAAFRYQSAATADGGPPGRGLPGSPNVGRVHALLEPRGLVELDGIVRAAVWQVAANGPPIGSAVYLREDAARHYLLAFPVDHAPSADTRDAVDFAQHEFPPMRRRE